MGYSTRLPAAPLKRELRKAKRKYGDTWDELAVRLRVSSRTLTRLLGARDIAEPVADRMACRLDLHPALIWPREWQHIAQTQERPNKEGVSMKVTIPIKALTTALKAVGPAAGRRSTLPILSGVMIQASGSKVVLETTDLEASARITVEDRVKVFQEGRVVLPSKAFGKSVSTMNGELAILVLRSRRQSV